LRGVAIGRRPSTWLARSLSEAQNPRIESAAEIAGALAELQAEPAALREIMGMLRPP